MGPPPPLLNPPKMGSPTLNDSRAMSNMERWGLLPSRLQLYRECTDNNLTLFASEAEFLFNIL